MSQEHLTPAPRAVLTVKSKFTIMIPIIAWAWLMHFTDMTFQILPVHFKAGFPFAWVWLPLGIMALMGGFLADRPGNENEWNVQAGGAENPERLDAGEARHHEI